MAVVVVGGHTRNIGKTTLAVQVLDAFSELRWTAMKITQFGHNVCSANGEPCDCSSGDHAVAVSEERSTTSGTDTARMLAAGAERVLWVRTQQGMLLDAMPRIHKELASEENVLLESNSILRFLRPDLYLAVLQPAVQDFKPSAMRYLDRADAVFLPVGKPESQLGTWPNVSPQLTAGKPVFTLDESGLAADAHRWLAQRLAASHESLAVATAP